MWRNVSWGSMGAADSSTLPEGMHKHEPGAYFKTPSIHSAGSAQSGAGPAYSAQSPPPQRFSNVGLESLSGAESAQLQLEELQLAPLESLPADEELDEQSRASSKQFSPESSTKARLGPQVARTIGSAKPQHSQTRRQRFREEQRQVLSQTASGLTMGGSSKQQAGGQAAGNRLAGSQPNQHQQQQAPMNERPQQGFRSRLSSISGALQHPKLTKRLFHHGEHGEHRTPIQITTTSIDSPQHQARASEFGQAGSDSEHNPEQPQPLEPRLTATSSGRRLSQLFLPQLANNPMLAGADPYANNDLIPPHLLGLYGQPPLVGGAASPGGPAGMAHRSSWADISLFGRLSNVRPSVDSAFHAGQMRHSFDARKYSSALYSSC